MISQAHNKFSLSKFGATSYLDLSKEINILSPLFYCLKLLNDSNIFFQIISQLLNDIEQLFLDNL
jgi:hypothetical protein